jgi:opacity protein-like surface antigen
MKRRLCLILFLLPLLATAQLRFSVFADPQISWLRPETRLAESAGVRAGIDVGLEMDNYFSDNYAFSTGLSLNSLGGRLKFNEEIDIQFNGSTRTIDPGDVVVYKLQYLNVPVGMKFTTREIGYTTIFVKLGLGGHFNIKSYADIAAQDISGESLSDEIELFNLSYHFGAGIQYSFGGQSALVCGFEYRHRFMDVASNQAFIALLNTFALKIGLLF